jgi:CDP-glycerol glycerophosphotransferase (TagB/SpsB family)
MARFTFSAGNARVLARAPLYALGALLAVLVPRSPHRWVFGSGIGLGEGALALIELTVAREPGRHVTWLASSRDELTAAQARGLRAVLKTGPRGLSTTLRAGVVVVTHGFGDVNRYGVSGARIVQLWHGIPLKKLQLDTGATFGLPLIGSLPGVGRLLTALYRRAGAQIALFPVASELVAARIRSAFGLSADRVIVTGDPRDDALLAGTPESRREAARQLVSAALVAAGGAALPADSPVVLYAPTWRDGAVDAAIPTPSEWQAIAQWADSANATLLIRSHPLGSGSYQDGVACSPRIRLLGRDALTDVTAALPALDALVTDYSSIAFDAAIAGVPSVFFAPDLAQYWATRGLYQPYREFSGGEPATTWAETLARLGGVRGAGVLGGLAAESGVLGDSRTRGAALAHAAWLRDEVVDHLDGRATQRVLDAILAMLGPHESPGPVGLRSPLGRPVPQRPLGSGGRDTHRSVPRDRATPETAVVRDRSSNGLPVAGLPGESAPVDDATALDLPHEDSRQRARRLVITGAELDGHTLAIRGQTPARILRMAMVGPRQSIEFTVHQDGTEFSASASLFDDRWGASQLAPRSDDYRLEVTLEGAERASARARVQAALDPGFYSPWMRAELRADAGTLVLRVEPPLRDDERGASAQKHLEKQYRRRTSTPENAVFFESFYSQTVACNPLALDREIAVVRPDVTRYWSVVDRSIAIPTGAVAIIEGSAEWWRVRADARLLVVNDWLRKRWMPRPHQTVIQTWHGTMVKKLALDRDRVGLRTRIAVRRESRRWNVLLAQNEYAAHILRRAYAFTGPIWVEGYPRNDVLAIRNEPVTGDQTEHVTKHVTKHVTVRGIVRARLGVRPEQRAVLYAPTWRDDAREIVDYLDLPSLPAALAELPGEHVVLVRGHSRTLRHGRDLNSPGLIDVTTYPDIADLLLAADVVITDYSSLMFDITTTSTPLVLFAPDRERYESELRGFYFDLLADAPVPVTESRQGVIDELARLAAADDAEPASRALIAWRERFTALDDGRAAERVVARIIAAGMLGQA